MKLFTRPGACSNADHILLEWSGLPYETEIVAREDLAARYPGDNPGGNVPFLLDGDMRLLQNAAIMVYISEKADPSTRLWGDGSAADRGEVMRWIAYANSDVHPTYGPVFSPPGTFVSEEHHADLMEHTAARIHKVYATADTRLRDRPWLAGDFRSGGDAYLLVTLWWAAKVGVDLSDYPHLMDFGARLAGDAAVQKVIREVTPDAG